MISRVDSSFLKGSLSLIPEDLELLYRMVDPDSLIEAFADKYKKSVEETRAAWNKAESLLAEQGKEEPYSTYYLTLVQEFEAILK
jgi:sugar-specific transcriptional regulator TrmB